MAGLKTKYWHLRADYRLRQLYVELDRHFWDVEKNWCSGYEFMASQVDDMMKHLPRKNWWLPEMMDDLVAIQQHLEALSAKAGE
jgi:hypothetical protein